MWLQIGLFVASLIISYLTRPQPKFTNPKPGTVEATAIAQAGADVPVLFGSRFITGQNIVWWGDTKSKAIKKKGGKK